MAEITRQRAGEMLRALFKVLLSAPPEGLSASEALKRTDQNLVLTPFENADYPKRPRVRRFERLVRFHSINAVKAGWLAKAGGIWTVTDQGRAAYEKYTDPAEFMGEATRLYHEWRKGQPEQPPTEVKTATVEDDQPEPAAAPRRRRVTMPDLRRRPACADCGRPTAGGVRCKACAVARRALVETADRDRAVLEMVEREGVNGDRLAVRLGFSRVRGYDLIRQARRREALRQARGISTR